VASQGLKHSDATSWRQGNQPRTLWTIATDLATVFAIVPDASMAGLRELFAKIKGILVGAFDLFMRAVPLVLAWQHEEWHRAVRCRTGTQCPQLAGVFLLSGVGQAGYGDLGGGGSQEVLALAY
jgi:hypothetical protein